MVDNARAPALPPGMSAPAAPTAPADPPKPRRGGRKAAGGAKPAGKPNGGTRRGPAPMTDDERAARDAARAEAATIDRRRDNLRIAAIAIHAPETLTELEIIQLGEAAMETLRPAKH